MAFNMRGITPLKQTESGKGNIFTRKGRIQRLVNLHASLSDGERKDRIAKRLSKKGVDYDILSNQPETEGYYIEGERPIEGTKATEIYSKEIKPRIR